MQFITHSSVSFPKHMHMTRSNKLLVAFSLISFGATAQQADGLEYGRNLISVSPVHLSERTPTGVGIQYERFVGSSGKLSLNFPLAYSFGQSDACDPTIRARVLYAYPGVKFYPAGYKHKVTYAVGPSVALGTGTTNCNCGETEIVAGDARPSGYKPVSEIGLMINNSVNLQASRHLYFGSEIGLGTSLLNTMGGKDMGTDVMLQMNIKVGYRL
jgi:hypothetical protein